MAARIYLDWNAGAPLLPEARDAVAGVLAGGAANPSSVHAEGRLARGVIEGAREHIAALVNASRGEIVLTSGGSEGNATALRGLVTGRGGPAGRVIALPGVEHPSVLDAAEQLGREGASIRLLPVDADGVMIVDALDEMLRHEAVDVVCVQLANSETGVIQPVERVAALVHAHGGLAHCDAVQGAGKIEVDVARLGVDTLALSAHKLGGLTGAGALFVREGCAIEPLIPGSQEHRRRGGTENVAGAAAFGAAARSARERLASWPPVAALRDRLEGEVLSRIKGVAVYGREVARLPNTSCLGLAASQLGPVVVAALDLCGFAVSSGPACSSRAERGSAVVKAMGYGDGAAGRTLRVSLAPPTGEDDVLAFVEALTGIVSRRKGGRP